ncbi:MAG: hypothetical protein ACAH80_18830 [Alphaproteobacteria bacterium]
MKKTFYALMLCLALLAPVAAQAFDTPLKDPKGVKVLEKLGIFFKPVADQFGCTDFAWGNVANAGKLATLEYVPPGHKVEQWTKLVTVTVYSLEGDPVQDKALMSAMVTALTKTFEANGKVISHSLYRNKAEEMSAYYEYETGLGGAKEHNAGVFMRVTPTLAAFMQVQARGGALAADDLLTIHKMVDPRANHPKKP